jgi:hypothetical protein
MHGVKIRGAMHPATSPPRVLGHGASDPDAMQLYLGADDYGAMRMVHFLKSFRQEPI